MSRLFSGIAALAFVATTATMAGANVCHGSNGKFVKCPKATTSSSSMMKKDAKGKCHGANGKFVKCAK